jgi:hypothetical protein
MKLFTRHHRLEGPAGEGYEITPHEFIKGGPLGRRTQEFCLGHRIIGAVSNAASLAVAITAR